MSEPDFSVEDMADAQHALRVALGMRKERLSMAEAISMLSDEIERMRAAGYDDALTAKIISEAARVTITADDIAAHHVPPGEGGLA